MAKFKNVKAKIHVLISQLNLSLLKHFMKNPPLPASKNVRHWEPCIWVHLVTS